MSSYQLILFDFDGTLCQSEMADIHALQKAYQSLNEPFPSLNIIQKAMKTGASSTNLLKQLSPDASSNFIQRLSEAYKKYYPIEAMSATLFPGVVFLLKQLKAAGINMAIVSNRDADLLSITTNVLEISQYFKAIIGVKAGGLYKPDPALYKNAIVPYFPNISNRATLMFGDTDTDLTFATNISIDACWASYGGGFHEKCKALQPKYTIHAPDELLNILELAGK